VPITVIITYRFANCKGRGRKIRLESRENIVLLRFFGPIAAKNIDGIMIAAGYAHNYSGGSATVLKYWMEAKTVASKG
jgi:hypothetical protein